MNKRKFEITIPINIYITYDADQISCKPYQDAILAARMDCETAVRKALVPYVGSLTVPMKEWDIEINTRDYEICDAGVVKGK